jgi:hypothetical protein
MSRKVPGVLGNVHLCDLLDDAVARGGNESFGTGFTLASPPLGVDDVITLTPSINHLTDQLRWVLKVTIDDNHGVTRRCGEAGHRGHGLTESA